MTHLVEIHASSELAGIVPSGDLLAIVPESLIADAPDAHWVLIDASDRIAARCSLWWRRVPSHGDQTLGVIGHFAAADSASGVELLRHSCAQLAAKSCTLAVGPMDGNTWRRYRFVTDRGNEPPFFLEPDNPDEWPRYFVADR